MAVPDRPHSNDCWGVANGRIPTLVTTYANVPGTRDTQMSMAEICAWCDYRASFIDGRYSERRFHRFWKATMATYIATWEHRNGFWDDATG